MGALVIPLEGVVSFTDLQELIEFVFPSVILPYPTARSKRAILSGTNRCIKKINEVILSRLTGYNTCIVQTFVWWKTPSL